MNGRPYSSNAILIANNLFDNNNYILYRSLLIPSGFHREDFETNQDGAWKYFPREIGQT